MTDSVNVHRHLIVVAREEPTLYSYLVERFHGDTNVLVVLDRRSGKDRRIMPVEDESKNRRGSSDRRGHPFLQDELRDRRHVVVSVGDVIAS
jgi:hypothetical protein